MKDAFQTAAAATPAITAYSWVPILMQINTVLTTVSLILGIVGAGFAVWRGVVWLQQRRADPR